MVTNEKANLISRKRKENFVSYFKSQEKRFSHWWEGGEAEGGKKLALEDNTSETACEPLHFHILVDLKFKTSIFWPSILLLSHTLTQMRISSYMWMFLHSSVN